jgi:DNA polymerase-3 subunit epsilon
VFEKSIATPTPFVHVVIDVVTSGLQAGRIDLSDSLEIVLQKGQASDRDNILIHGIGGPAQKEGGQPVILLFVDAVVWVPGVARRASSFL